MLIYILMLPMYYLGMCLTYKLNTPHAKMKADTYYRYLYFITPAFIRTVLTVLPFMVVYNHCPIWLFWMNGLFNELLDYYRVKGKINVIITQIFQAILMFVSILLYKEIR